VRFTPGCFADAIQLLESKKVNVAPLITSTMSMTNIQEAFQMQHARKHIKIVIMNQE
jgi:D-xylulose reductase